MLLLTAACALISVLMIAVVSLWHRRARGPEGLAQEKALYAGFVADVERRRAAGDLDEDAAQEERAEAARALLKASDQTMAAQAIKPVWLMAVTIAVAGITFGLYLVFGHPTLSDAPYKTRLATWTADAGLPSCLPADGYKTRLTQWLDHAARDPGRLPEPLALAAVQRQSIQTCAGVPDYWIFLGRLDKAAGDYHASAQDFRKAHDAAPKVFTAWSEWGEAVTLFDGRDNAPDAQLIFANALKQDPNDVMAHYYLGRATLAASHFAAARSHFTAALIGLAADDGRRSEVEAELKAVDQAEAVDLATKTRIAGMVASLAESLKADPGNADGWARLLRSYDVMGDTKAHDAAVAEVRAHFPAGQAAAIIAKSQGAVGAEDTGGAP